MNDKKDAERPGWVIEYTEYTEDGEYAEDAWKLSDSDDGAKVWPTYDSAISRRNMNAVASSFESGPRRTWRVREVQ